MTDLQVTPPNGVAEFRARLRDASGACMPDSAPMRRALTTAKTLVGMAGRGE